MTAAERVEARHRLVEEHHVGLVQQRLGEPDALDHALGVLPQPQPPFGADAHIVEDARDPGGGVGAAEAEEPREVA